MTKSFRQFRVDSICSTSDPDSILNEAGLDDYVADKVTGTASTGAKKALSRISPTKKARAARHDRKEKKVQKKDSIRNAKERINRLNQELRDKQNITPERKNEIKASLVQAKLALRKAQISENLLYEQPIIDAMKKIVRDRQYQKIKLADGKQLSVDMQTANAIIKVYDALNATNKNKFATVLGRNRQGFLKMSSFAIKNVSY